MSYSDFSLSEATRRFGLSVSDDATLFPDTPDAVPSDFLRSVLAEFAPLALSLQTEKARSEFLIAPVLAEVRRVSDRQISLFSGADFSVDPDVGLNGICDYILSRSPHLLFIAAPVLAVIEAKKENITAGLGQCAAAMVAAQRFNERENNLIPTIYGAVTTGDVWRFLRLENTRLQIDAGNYYYDSLPSLLGVLFTITQSEVAGR